MLILSVSENIQRKHLITFRVLNVLYANFTGVYVFIDCVLGILKLLGIINWICVIKLASLLKM